MTAPFAKEIFILDDDQEVAKAVEFLMHSVGLTARSFHDPRPFVAGEVNFENCGCLILDLRMPFFSGLEVHTAMVQQAIEVPVIFLSGHGDIPTALRAIRGGAVDFLVKPCEGQVLIDRVNSVLRESHDPVALTPRERDAAEGIFRGETSAATASRLGISRRTAEVHRARLLKRLNVNRTADALPVIRRIFGNGSL